MIFRKCIVCNQKNLKIGSRKSKLIDKFSNSDKFSLSLILNDSNIEIIEIFQCKRCGQRNVKIKNLETNKIEEFWLEYLCKLKLIEKELFDIEEAIERLKSLNKDNHVIDQKVQLLSQSYEVSKIRKETLKHNMMASISIKIQAAIR